MKLERGEDWLWGAIVNIGEERQGRYTWDAVGYFNRGDHLL